MAEKTFIMTSKRTAKLLLLSIAFICMGLLLNYAATQSTITGRAVAGAIGDADLAHAAIGILIAIVLSLLIIHILKNKKI